MAEVNETKEVEVDNIMPNTNGKKCFNSTHPTVLSFTNDYIFIHFLSLLPAATVIMEGLFSNFQKM